MKTILSIAIKNYFIGVIICILLTIKPNGNPMIIMLQKHNSFLSCLPIIMGTLLIIGVLQLFNVNNMLKKMMPWEYGVLLISGIFSGTIGLLVVLKLYRIGLCAILLFLILYLALLSKRVNTDHIK